MDKYIHSEEGSIEDMIGQPTYFGLINLSYKLPRKKRLPLTGPDENASTDRMHKRILRQVEERFNAGELNTGSFDRCKPAEFLVEHTAKCLKKLPDLSKALDRFEKLFVDVNTCSTCSQIPRSPDYGNIRPIVDTGSRKKAGQVTEVERV
jgi:hypothetical protein